MKRVRRLLTGTPVIRDRKLVIQETKATECREWGAFAEQWSGTPRVLMAAGHGYGNVGDEAQCGACIKRWREVAPECRITLFSPNPGYTEALHQEKCEWAPRVAWFQSNTSSLYFGDWKRFTRFFLWLKLRLTLSAQMMRRGLPLIFCNPREAQVLQILQEHDVLHISGGGFLTGKTRSRLWENCLLMQMCQILDVPYILTGHNIGVFQDNADRRVVKLGLRGATYIGLRDRGISESELAEIGIEGSHVESTCDDALFCQRLETSAVETYLADVGVSSDKPWVAVNFHHWGQSTDIRGSIEQRFAEICDCIVSEHGLQVVFIAMTPSDVDPELNVINRMKQKGTLAPYNPDYKVVRGIIADAQFVFTMKHHPIVFAQGEKVPVIAVALDDYYLHKNMGAMDNTGHSAYMVNSVEFDTDKPLKLIRQILKTRDELIKEIGDCIEKLKITELKTYSRILSKLNKE